MPEWPCRWGPAGALRYRMSRCVCKLRKHQCHTHVWDTNTQLHSKLGRIYTLTLDEDEQLVGLAERLRDLIQLAQDFPARPDVVLIDSHAGFHDIGAAAVVRLGAETLLFGRNDRSSWWAYTALFEYLRTANSVCGRQENT